MARRSSRSLSEGERAERRRRDRERLQRAAQDEITADPEAIDNAIDAREALRALAQLPARQRDDLTLFVAGYTYREIAEMTGDRTFTNVQKHLARARAKIRLDRLATTDLVRR